MELFYKKNSRHAGMRGLTLTEVVIYVSILALTLVAVIFAIIGVSRSYASTQAQTRIGRAAALSVSRITYEVRFAETVDTVLSTFGTHPGVLVVTTANPSHTARVYVENGILKFDENGVYVGDLTPSGVFVSAFIVTHIQSDSSDAIHVELSLDAHSKTGTTTETFYSTTVLRGSYTQ